MGYAMKPLPPLIPCFKGQYNLMDFPVTYKSILMVEFLLLKFYCGVKKNSDSMGSKIWLKVKSHWRGWKIETTWLIGENFNRICRLGRSNIIAWKTPEFTEHGLATLPLNSVKRNLSRGIFDVKPLFRWGIVSNPYQFIAMRIGYKTTFEIWP